ncbi:hypothetical protein ACFQU0_10085 [Hydrogenophaga defluvii]|uniref:Uncharacterized protein n=1 Tax=Hydrogenophaga defluvii TaxID=249410 RepID=A0ABW2SCR3_9BURK
MAYVARTHETRLIVGRLAFLKVQDRVLAFAHAGGAQVGRLSCAISICWAGVDVNATSHFDKVIALKLGLGFARLGELGFKFAIRVSELRYFGLLKQSRLLELKHGLPGISQQLEKLGSCLLQLRRVALADEALDDRFDARER